MVRTCRSERPSASCAVTVTLLIPGCKEIAAIDQLVVPSADPSAPESALHVTRVTLSVAEPRSATVPVTLVHCESAVGDDTLSFGSPSGRATARTAVALSPSAATAVTVTIVVPEFSGTDGMLQRDVPCATPVSPRSVLHLTNVIPAADVAVPAIPMPVLDVVN